MGDSPARPFGFLTFTLHAHLPYVVNHGTWPHGMEWLHEATAETYLPLLRMLGRLERDGVPLPCNLNLSPILLEQFAHPVFQAEFPHYLERKILAAREDEAFFASIGDAHFAATARFWQQFFTEARQDFEALGRDVIRGFRGFAERGLIDIITCAASHGYLPLLGTDESVRAQIRTAVAAHTGHLGRAPVGIWIPECGYRPGGQWQFPVQPEGQPMPHSSDRVGVEEVLAESGLQYFFVDTHLVEEGHKANSPYASGPASPANTLLSEKPEGLSRVYHPFFVGSASGKTSPVTAFSRDPQTGLQVWSADFGYPGDERYLDFHKKRWPGGHRYWRVTGAGVDLGDKDRYDPAAAAARVQEHASHFVHLVWQTLQPHTADPAPPILCSPFDAELFGHWWFEGPLWLEAVARILHDYDAGVSLISCAAYLERFPRAGALVLEEGSWGAEGNNQVWLNSLTEWTYKHLYGAELACRDICTSGRWKDGHTGERIVRQLCRELLLLQSSDWQFLITTGAARDYAEQRFNTHLEQFNDLREFWDQHDQGKALRPEQMERLAFIENRDGIFANIDPELWAIAAHQEIPPHSEPVEAGPPQPSRAAPAQGDATVSEVAKFMPSKSL